MENNLRNRLIRANEILIDNNKTPLLIAMDVFYESGKKYKLNEENVAKIEGFTKKLFLLKKYQPIFMSVFDERENKSLTCSIREFSMYHTFTIHDGSYVLEYFRMNNTGLKSLKKFIPTLKAKKADTIKISNNY